MINKVTLMGFVGSDPQISTATYGTRCTFSLATNETYNKKDGTTVEEVFWHDCVVWNKVAENAAKFIKKGTMVFLEGKLTYWEQDKDGIKVKRTNVKVDSFWVLKNQKDVSIVQQNEITQKEVDNNLSVEDDNPFDVRGVIQDFSDLPF